LMLRHVILAEGLVAIFAFFVLLCLFAALCALCQFGPRGGKVRGLFKPVLPMVWDQVRCPILE
jgi:hypothetical protein